MEKPNLFILVAEYTVTPVCGVARGKKAYSFADNDTDVSLIQFIHFSVISKASYSSLDIQLEYDGVQEQYLQRVARCPWGAVRVTAVCLRLQLLKHLPIWLTICMTWEFHIPVPWRIL